MLIAHHEKKPVVVVRLTWKLQKYEKPFHVAPIPVNSQANWKSKYLVRTLERPDKGNTLECSGRTTSGGHERQKRKGGLRYRSRLLRAGDFMKVSVDRPKSRQQLEASRSSCTRSGTLGLGREVLSRRECARR
jgi:hypothetical protein